jgi:hypothetical protein
MVVMVILTLGTLKQLRAEPLPAIRDRGTDVVPAPATHQLDVSARPIPAATPIAGRDVSA